MFLKAAILSNILLAPALCQQTPAPINSCHKDSFIFPKVAGAEVTGISAPKVTNYTDYSVTPGVRTPTSFTIDFCNVTVSYTHPGWDDVVNANVWLPLHDWNGRFYALGGGGYAVGFGPIYMTKAVATGFAAVQSDGGIGLGMEAALSPKAWALASRGNVNLHNLENYASRGVCLRDDFHRQGNHGKLLRQKTRLFIFRRLLGRRPSGSDGSSTPSQ